MRLLDTKVRRALLIAFLTGVIWLVFKKLGGDGSATFSISAPGLTIGHRDGDHVSFTQRIWNWWIAPPAANRPVSEKASSPAGAKFANRNQVESRKQIDVKPLFEIQKQTAPTAAGRPRNVELVVPSHTEPLRAERGFAESNSGTGSEAVIVIRLDSKQRREEVTAPVSLEGVAVSKAMAYAVIAPRVGWLVDDANCGTISEDGLYTPPPAPHGELTCHVRRVAYDDDGSSRVDVRTVSVAAEN